jgi:hypothetical protein
MAKETHIKTDKNPLSAGVLGSYIFSRMMHINASFIRFDIE